MSKSLKRKPKNQPVVQQPQVNLMTALPDTNDFRTSLLMPQLSARFSMLREQDDPNTKVGKANDDSVLFPKRASRLNLFAHNPLSDIAEVESVHTTIRPPFARADRSQSLSDGYNSDDGGSIMSRSKPGEGNNLFGGRQKMYRVPAAGESARTLTETGSRGSGMTKHVYDDDVSKSVYQKYRAEARELERPDSLARDDREETDAVNSPMTAFSKNRGTTSSTTSGPSNRRTSTAATSITSESPIPRQNSHGFGGKSRTSDSVNGSDESLVKRFPSSDSRKNCTSREGSIQPPVPSINQSLSQSRSAVNLSEKYSRSPMFTSTAFRAASPPPPSNAQAIASLDLGLQETVQRVASPTRRYLPSSPSPIEDEADQVYTSNLQPNDHGKATAMGLFNRPQQQFDEQQFLQRQRQMFEGRSSPFPAESRAESRASSEAPNSAMRRIDAALGNGRDSSSSLQPANLNYTSAASLPQPKGLRSFTSPNKTEPVQNRPRNQSSLSSASEHVNVQARVESLIRRQNAELAALEVERSVVTESYNNRKASQGSESLNQTHRGTFFNNFDASEDESDRSLQRESQPQIAPSDIHPALRKGAHGFDFGDDASLTPRITYRESHASHASNTRSMNDSVIDSRRPSQVTGDDSPNLGPNGLGLSGMIRSHLRHDSDRSSVYPPSPRVSNFSHRQVSMASTTHTINPPESIHSDPWEFDSASRNQVSSQPESRSSDVTPTMSQKAQQILGHVQKQPATSKAQQILGQEAPNMSAESVHSRSWQDEHASHHRRGESTETQKERQDFDNELAERQRRIQERLKAAAEPDIQSRSPRQERSNFPGSALSALKKKPSLGNMAPPERPNPQPKAMKMLGISSHDDISVLSPVHSRSQESEDPYARPHQYHQPAQRPPPIDNSYRSGRKTPVDGRPPMDPYANGRRTPAENRAPIDPYASGRRTPADGRGPMDPYANGRRTPAEGRPPMDPYASGRRTPAEGRVPYGNGSYEDFERHRQRSATPNSGRPRRDRAPSNAVDGPRSRQGHYRDESGYGNAYERSAQSPSPPDMRSRRGAPTPDLYDRSPSAMSSRPRNGSRPPHQGYFDNRIQPSQSPMPPQMALPPGGGPPRPSPRPPVPASPMSPFQEPGTGPSPPFANPNSTMQSPVLSSSNMVNNGSGRVGRDRKKSVTRGMISEPKFVSSTSSIPLVDLPQGAPSPRPNPIASPPVPAMNPRRRGNANDVGFSGYSHSAQPSPSLPMMSPPPSAYETSSQYGQYNHPSQYTSNAAQYGGTPYADQPGGRGKPSPRDRNRLRKTSSEGGNLASRARQQALIEEMGNENHNSPRVPIFPNRSATSLGMAQHDGGMF